MGLLGHRLTVSLTCEKLQTVFQSGCTTLHFQEQQMRVLADPQFCQHVTMLAFLILAIPVGKTVLSALNFLCNFIRKQLILFMLVYFWIFCCLPPIGAHAFPRAPWS